MNDREFRNRLNQDLPDAPEIFHRAMTDTLKTIVREEGKRRAASARKLRRTLLIAALITLLLASAAVAAYHWRLFDAVWFFNTPPASEGVARQSHLFKGTVNGVEVTVNEDIEIAVVDVEILDAPTVTSVEVTESSYDADDVLTAGSFPDSITLNFSAPVEDAPALTGRTVQFGEGELSDDGMSATYTATTKGADTDGFSIAASEIVGENGVINVTATSFTVDGETVTVND